MTDTTGQEETEGRPYGYGAMAVRLGEQALEIERLTRRMRETEAKAALTDEAKWFVEQGLSQCKAENLILHIPMYEDWLAAYDALEQAQGG